jgi:class 3 adenylate cyclase
MHDSTLREVMDEWDALRARPASASDTRLCELAERSLAMGHATLACEILRERVGLPGARPEARYLSALALARIGSLAEASALIEGLLAGGMAGQPVEWLALAGRIAKDRWASLAEESGKARMGELSLARYRQAWEDSGDIFPGINAATMALLTGDAVLSRALAQAVMAHAQADDQAKSHWRLATLAEAALLLGEHEAAEAHYRAAAGIAGRQWGDIASMRRQLKLIARCLPVAESLLAALRQPGIVVFTGHLLDAPGRETPRFPEALEAEVGAQIASRLEAMDAGIGFSSAACGADLLFVEAMLARGAEVHVTLPFDRGDFIATSVAHAGPGWVRRFDAALAAATSVTYGVKERYLGDDALFSHAGKLMLGAAVLRARQLETEPVMLAVVDPRSEGRAGGAADLLGQWTRLGLPREVVDPAILPRASAGIPGASAASKVMVRGNSLRREVKAMLFADMVGYSRLQEEDTPAFLVNFLGAIADILSSSERKPVFANTWGDGLYLVFEAVEDGAELALRIRDSVRDRDWTAFGLPPGMNVRIGMHTGPVFRAPDPMLGRDNFFGSHVNLAARIEPVAAAGTVCVSAEMAYSLAATGDRRFALDYLGCLPLAKGAGDAPLYRLRRSDAGE